MLHPGGLEARATPDPHQSNTVSDLRAGSGFLLRLEFLTQFWLIFVKCDRSCSLFINMNETIFSDFFKESGTVCHLVYHCLSMFRPSQRPNCGLYPIKTIRYLFSMPGSVWNQKWPKQNEGRDSISISKKKTTISIATKKIQSFLWN